MKSILSPRDRTPPKYQWPINVQEFSESFFDAICAAGASVCLGSSDAKNLCYPYSSNIDPCDGVAMLDALRESLLTNYQFANHFQ